VIRVAGYVLNAVITRLGRPPSGWMQRHFADQQAVTALLFMSLTWGFCFVLWELHILGGGDAKTLMGMFGLFPTSDFAVFLAVAVLILSLPLLLLRLRGRPLRDIRRALGQRLQRGTLLPTQRQLEEEGRPYAWTFCLPGVVYLWFLW
jgi:Flp pilus assembly protein protease CpaA